MEILGMESVDSQTKNWYRTVCQMLCASGLLLTGATPVPSLAIPARICRDKHTHTQSLPPSHPQVLAGLTEAVPGATGIFRATAVAGGTLLPGCREMDINTEYEYGQNRSAGVSLRRNINKRMRYACVRMLH